MNIPSCAQDTKHDSCSVEGGYKQSLQHRHFYCNTQRIVFTVNLQRQDKTQSSSCCYVCSKASDCRHSNLAWINGDGCTGSRGRFRRRAESGSSDGTRGGTATGDRLKATGGRAARAAQRRHRVTVVGTGEAVEDEVDGVTHVEDGSCRKQLVADPVNRRWVLPMPVTS